MKLDSYNADVGFCSTGQLCNAKVATATIYGDKRSPVVGLCVTPKSAGSACTAGTGKILYRAVTTHHVLARSACKCAPACFYLRLPKRCFQPLTQADLPNQRHAFAVCSSYCLSSPHIATRLQWPPSSACFCTLSLCSQQGPLICHAEPM